MSRPSPYPARLHPERHEPPLQSAVAAHPRDHRDEPAPALQSGWEPTEAQLAAFGRTVLSWHQIVTEDGSQSPMCTCHSWAVLCPYVRAARDTMRMPVPWDAR